MCSALSSGQKTPVRTLARAAVPWVCRPVGGWIIELLSFYLGSGETGVVENAVVRNGLSGGSMDAFLYVRAAAEGVVLRNVSGANLRALQSSGCLVYGSDVDPCQFDLSELLSL